MKVRPTIPRPLAGQLAVTLACVLIFAASAAAQDLEDGPARGRPIEGGGAADLDQLVGRSSVIVRGVVTGGEAKWVGNVIYTHYDILVEETVKGPAKNRVTIAVPGGALGNVALSIPGAPALSSGQEIVFFGEPLGSAPSTFRAVGFIDGIVPVSRTSAGGSSVKRGGQPQDLDEFLDQVRQRGRGRR